MTKLSQFQTEINADPGDYIIAYSPVANDDVKIPILNLFANAALTPANLIITGPVTPVNSVATTFPGQIWFDTNYMYVGVANNVIKRIALSPF